MMKMVKMKGNMKGWDDEDGGREGDERDILGYWERFILWSPHEETMV